MPSTSSLCFSILFHWSFVIPALPIPVLLYPAIQFTLSAVCCSGVFIYHIESSILKLFLITVFSTYHFLPALLLDFYTSTSFVLLQSSCTSFSHNWNAIFWNEVFLISWANLDFLLILFHSYCVFLISSTLACLYPSVAKVVAKSVIWYPFPFLTGTSFCLGKLYSYLEISFPKLLTSEIWTELSLSSIPLLCSRHCLKYFYVS